MPCAHQPMFFSLRARCAPDSENSAPAALFFFANNLPQSVV
jgi:hypothetical protein